MSNTPANLRYTKSHEWVEKLSDGTMRVGITDHAQGLLGDMVYVEVPDVGRDGKGPVPGLKAEYLFHFTLQSGLAGRQPDIGQEKEVPVGFTGLRVVHPPGLQGRDAGIVALEPGYYFPDSAVLERGPDVRLAAQQLEFHGVFKPRRASQQPVEDSVIQNSRPLVDAFSAHSRGVR